MRAKTLIPVFATIHLVCLVVVFFVWGNFEFEDSIREAVAQKIVFGLAFPLVWLSAGSHSAVPGLILVPANSVLWGAGMFGLVRVIRRGRGREGKLSA
ncbi:MAG: hypothetical protein AAGI68_01865 [Planctomycetota bacterium]